MPKKKSDPSPDALAAEARTLRRWLERNAPDVRWRDVTLEPGAPPAVAAFWSALGYSELIAKADIAEPEDSEARIVATLADWRKQKMAKLTRADLPKHSRLIHLDNAGVGFLVMDETGALHQVIADKNRVSRSKEKWYQHIAGAVIAATLHKQWPSMTFKGPAPESEAIFPTLAPHVRALGEGLVLREVRGFAAIHYGDLSLLLAWLKTAPKTLKPDLFLANVVPSYQLAPVDPLPLLSDVTTRGGLSFGTLDGQAALHVREGKRWTLVAADEHRAYAFVNDVRPSQPWHVPRCGGAVTILVPPFEGKTPNDAAFAEAVARLKTIVPPRSSGRVPNDLPRRLGELVRAIQTPDLPTLGESEATVAQCGVARDKLPARARVIEIGRSMGSDYLLLTDEGSDDPPLIYCSRSARCVSFVDTRVTHFLAVRALQAVAKGRTLAPLRPPPDAPAPASAIVPELKEIEPGLFHLINVGSFRGGS